MTALPRQTPTPGCLFRCVEGRTYLIRHMLFHLRQFDPDEGQRIEEDCHAATDEAKREGIASDFVIDPEEITFDELCTALDALAPPGTTFGEHGSEDGAWGYWDANQRV